LLPVLSTNGHFNPGYERWLETNIRRQKQEGYFVATVTVPQGNLTTAQLRGLAAISRNAGDSLVRFSIDQNVMIGYIPKRNLKRVYAALLEVGLADAGAHQIEDVVTCPGAYSCNLALTKSMNLGHALSEVVKNYEDVQIRQLSIRISGCPNSCGQHWIGDLGFYGNARKIDGKEVPYYQMLLGGGYDRDGMMRFGLAIQSIPARLAPVAVDRVLKHYLANRRDEEGFREYVLRHKVETFRALTNDLAKPADTFPEMYRDWGDEVSYSLKLGKGECAA
jgi:sulfite reductase beta subunit-like hemoprotein